MPDIAFNLKAVNYIFNPWPNRQVFSAVNQIRIVFDRNIYFAPEHVNRINTIVTRVRATFMYKAITPEMLKEFETATIYEMLILIDKNLLSTSVPTYEPYGVLKADPLFDLYD